MTLRNRVAQWLGTAAVEDVEDGALDSIHERRFGNADRARFNHLWRELSRVLRVSPKELNENDVLETLAGAASRFPYTTMDLLSDLTSEESVGVPDRPLKTVGDLMDWLLANPRP